MLQVTNYDKDDHSDKDEDQYDNSYMEDLDKVFACEKDEEEPEDGERPEEDNSLMTKFDGSNKKR